MSQRAGQLRIQPASTTANIDAAGGAVVPAEISLEGSPRPLKGSVLVTSDDGAFEPRSVIEKRRRERSIALDVHGAYRGNGVLRRLTLTYAVDGLSTTQQVTLSVSPVRTAVPQPAPVVTEASPTRSKDPFASPSPIVAAPVIIRLIAGIIDLVIAGVLATASAFVLAVSLAIAVGMPCGFEDYTPGTNCYRFEEAWAYTATIWWAAAPPLYFAVSNAIGRSLGKRMLGLRVVCIAARTIRENPPRRGPGSWRGLVRAVASIIGLACFGLGYAWMFFNRDRRTWHDLASGTAVVRAEPS